MKTRYTVAVAGRFQNRPSATALTLSSAWGDFAACLRTSMAINYFIEGALRYVS